MSTKELLEEIARQGGGEYKEWDAGYLDPNEEVRENRKPVLQCNFQITTKDLLLREVSLIEPGANQGIIDTVEKAKENARLHLLFHIASAGVKKLENDRKIDTALAELKAAPTSPYSIPAPASKKSREIALEAAMKFGSGLADTLKKAREIETWLNGEDLRLHYTEILSTCRRRDLFDQTSKQSVRDHLAWMNSAIEFLLHVGANKHSYFFGTHDEIEMHTEWMKGLGSSGLTRKEGDIRQTLTYGDFSFHFIDVADLIHWQDKQKSSRVNPGDCAGPTQPPATPL